jgi:hypothetical protein
MVKTRLKPRPRVEFGFVTLNNHSYLTAFYAHLATNFIVYP